MRRLVLARNWPFRRCNQGGHRSLFIPLITFITCLVITIFVFLMSAVVVSSSRVMREEMFAASWKEAAKLATEEAFSNKTRTKTTITATTLPLLFPFQVDSKNDQTRTKGVAKGNVSIKLCYVFNYASGFYLSFSRMFNFAFLFQLFGFIIVCYVVLSSLSWLPSHLNINLDRLAKLERISPSLDNEMLCDSSLRENRIERQLPRLFLLRFVSNYCTTRRRSQLG